MEEVFKDSQDQDWVMVATWRRKYIMRPPAANHLAAGQFCTNYNNLDKSKNNINIGNLRRQLSATGVVYSPTGLVPVVTNSQRFQNCPPNLPSHILLSNGSILQLRKRPGILCQTGLWNHYGLRIVCEPFADENELLEEVNLPDITGLEDRFKQMFPFSACPTE